MEACQIKAKQRIAAAMPLRQAYPKDFTFDAAAALKGTVIFLRRSDEEGPVTVMGRHYNVSANWPHRLVRVEANFTQSELRLYGLRRAAPTAQPLLHSQPYERDAKQPGGLRALRDGATRGRRLDKKPSKP